MFKKPTFLAVRYIGTAAFVWLAACSSSSNVTRDASASGQNNPDGGAVAVVPCDPTVYCTNPLTCIGSSCRGCVCQPSSRLSDRDPKELRPRKNFAPASRLGGFLYGTNENWS